MPFIETCRMEERIRMLSEYDTGNWSVAELCRRHGVCRETFYEWRRRRGGGASDWFVDRSHAPLHCPHTTSAELREAIISLLHPASPQENGRHERMHRTLHEQTARPPARNATAQQASFDAFRKHYNEERPHEALGQRPPQEFYLPPP